jgi:hypothetical protein
MTAMLSKSNAWLRAARTTSWRPQATALLEDDRSEHARRNGAAWNADDDQAPHSQQLASDGKAWGTWDLLERELQVLGEVTGRAILTPLWRPAGSSCPRLGDCDDQIDDWVLDLGIGVDVDDALR